MKKLKSIKWSLYLPFVVLITVGAYFSFTAFQGTINPLTMLFLEKATIAIILAVSLNLVVGFLGELSLGHAGFMCIGAYVGAKLTVVLTEKLGEGYAIPILLIALLVGGLIAAFFGILVALPALRLRGDYLAIVTLAFGEIVRTVLPNLPESWFGGQTGQPSSYFAPYEKYLFVVGLVLVIVTMAVIQNLMRSKHGRAITSIRDSEIAARACGINVTKYKLLAFAVSAFFAGIAGALFARTQSTIQPATFDYNYSIEILVMVVLGGMGSLTGSVISAVLITYLNEQLQIVLTGDMAVLRGLLYAVVMILLIIYRNAPALKGFREKWSVKKLLSKLKKDDPSKIHDDEAEWHRVPTKITIDEVLSVDIQTNSPYTPDKQQKEDK